MKIIIISNNTTKNRNLKLQKVTNLEKIVCMETNTFIMLMKIKIIFIKTMKNQDLLLRKAINLEKIKTTITTIII